MQHLVRMRTILLPPRIFLSGNLYPDFGEWGYLSLRDIRMESFISTGGGDGDNSPAITPVLIQLFCLQCMTEVASVCCCNQLLEIRKPDHGRFVYLADLFIWSWCNNAIIACPKLYWQLILYSHIKFDIHTSRLTRPGPINMSVEACSFHTASTCIYIYNLYTIGWGI